MGKEIITQVQETQRVPNRKTQEKHSKTHINQINKDQTQRTNIKSSKEKTTNNTQRDSLCDLLIETLQATREWQGILKVMKVNNLQARREWQDILKMMKEKNLQPRLLYPARTLFKYEGEIEKLCRQAKAERIQHHQTSSPTNAKGSSLDRKHKKGV